jgi:hypothetical protein
VGEEAISDARVEIEGGAEVEPEGSRGEIKSRDAAEVEAEVE